MPKKGQKLSEEAKQKLRILALGRKHSEETKQKISILQTGKKRKPHSEETKRKIGLSNKGKKYSEEVKQKMRGKIISNETRRKISIANKGKGRKKGFHISEQQKQQISLFWKGKRMGKENPSKRPEVRKKLKEAWEKRREKGWKSKQKNIPRSEETKRKISFANSGEKNGGYIDGRSYKRRNYKQFSISLKKEIKKRDNFECQECKSKEKLNVHHIDYNKQNNKKENLITLCSKCHSKTNFRREGWTNYFKLKIDKIIRQKE